MHALEGNIHAPAGTITNWHEYKLDNIHIVIASEREAISRVARSSGYRVGKRFDRLPTRASINRCRVGTNDVPTLHGMALRRRL